MSKNNSIMDWMTAIYKESLHSELSEGFFSSKSGVYGELCSLSMAFDVTPVQATLLSIIVMLPFSDLKSICCHTGCLLSELLARKDDFIYLVNRGLIMQSRSIMMDANFKIAPEAMERWIDNLPYECRMDARKVYDDMICSLESKFSALEHGTTDAAGLKQTVISYLDMYHDSYLTDKLYTIWGDPYKSWSELSVVLYMFLVLNSTDDSLTDIEVCKMLFDIESDENISKTVAILNDLEGKGYIEYTRGVGFLKLKEKYVELLSFRNHSKGDDDVDAHADAFDQTGSGQAVIADGTCVFIPDDTIKEKQLFFNRTECESLDELRMLFSTDKFNEVIGRMHNKGMRTGFNCLLYGAPGTGKTEFVNQLARSSGRPIVKADFSELRNRCVGESEKAIRKVFAVYRDMTEKLEVIPILLLNECDGLLGKRVDVIDSADQLNNACQAIMLEELENLNGICICTTNMPQKMDEAFERRFLYKIEFHNPDESTRREIWHSLRPELSNNDLSVLAGNYRLSGGQIENVVRKMEIYNIIHGVEQTTLDTIKSRCEKEINSYNKHSLSENRIGFN